MFAWAISFQQHLSFGRVMTLYLDFYCFILLDIYVTPPVKSFFAAAEYSTALRDRKHIVHFSI